MQVPCQATPREEQREIERGGTQIPNVIHLLSVFQCHFDIIFLKCPLVAKPFLPPGFLLQAKTSASLVHNLEAHRSAVRLDAAEAEERSSSPTDFISLPS